MKPEILLTVLAALAGALHIFSEVRQHPRATYVFKPLVCVLLIVMVFYFGKNAPQNYRNWIMIGLGFSLLGDVFLMLKEEKFIPGLGTFFLAHVCYCMGFVQFIDSDHKIPWISYFALLVVASFIWGFLQDGVEKKLKWPVVAYIAIIVIMVMLARTWLTQAAQGGYLGLTLSAAGLAYAGALVFMASDTSLAINKFKKPFKGAEFVTLPTYYLAQLLIAWSVLVLRP